MEDLSSTINNYFKLNYLSIQIKRAESWQDRYKNVMHGTTVYCLQETHVKYNDAVELKEDGKRPCQY